MSDNKELANQLLEAGVHFGHQKRKWNPKMKSFIYGSKNGVYIINLEKTLEKLDEARAFLKKTAQNGGKILFVGTKPQAQDIVRESALQCEMPYVNHRWLGGLLTNFDTLKQSVGRYLNLKKMTTDGTFDKISKKEASTINKEIAKLEKNLLGVTSMEKLPQAVFVVDAHREIIAVKEAVRLEIPVVAIADTDADPDLIQYPIPGNDDAIRSVKLLVKLVTDAIMEGVAERPKLEKKEKEEKKDAEEPKEAEAQKAAKDE